MANQWQCNVCGARNADKYDKCLLCNNPKGTESAPREQASGEKASSITILNAPENYANPGKGARWEYLTVLVQVSEKEFLHSVQYLSKAEMFSCLEKYGSCGWELVGVIPAQTWHQGEIGSEVLVEAIAFLKRQREEQFGN